MIPAESTGGICFRQLLQDQQPRIPGVRLPVAGVFVDRHGQPFLDAPLGASEIHRMFPGYAFSKAAAQLRMTSYADATNAVRLYGEIKKTELAEDEHAMEKAIIDFNRPMLGRSARFPCGVSVWKRGEALKYGRHPMANSLFSVLGGLDHLGRLRMEGVITSADEARLRDDLTGEHFKRLAPVDPEHIVLIKGLVLEKPEIIDNLPHELRELVEIAATI